MEKLPIRLENAVTKLYNAFHAGELKAMDCTACAVGNICDNRADWRWCGLWSGTSKKYSDAFGYEPEKVIEESGYKPMELKNIERLFMYGVRDGDNRILHYHNDGTKEVQYKGLCRVVEYLCELDNVPNVMDIQSLFDYEGEKPKNELSKVFI